MIFPLVNLSSLPSSPILTRLHLVNDVLLSLPDLSDTTTLEVFLAQYPINKYWVCPEKIQGLQNSDIFQTVIRILDSGAQKVVLPVPLLLSGDFDSLPQDRVAANFSLSQGENVFEQVKGLVSAFVISTTADHKDKARKLIEQAQKTVLPSGGLHKFAIQLPANTEIDLELINQFADSNAGLTVQIERLTVDTTTEEQGKVHLADALMCTLKSDRPDGLFTTIVVDEHGVALGVVYSSIESIKEALKTGTGVYQSRKRGLWFKGATSGAVQELRGVDMDCDRDTVRFVVKQHGSGFCHLNFRTCFGAYSGLAALENVLQSRKESAPAGSYTKRLFDDPALLQSKIMEEADEFCAATMKTDIAWEAADLIYFALVKCVANDVSLVDVEAQLDKRAKKVTRRPGNAKPQWDVSLQKNDAGISGTTLESKLNCKKEFTTTTSTLSSTELEIIKMQKFNAEEISTEKRSALLLRPIIKSDDIIARVRPIVQDVRRRGDAALIDLTAKFDGVRLNSPVISAPFPPEAMALDDETRDAIDRAYDNIYKFHEAQYDRSALTVETMPGVMCSRFSRPIAKVGLYVPGGTAILPSTTLMLGIPARVAGCKEIVIASPPRKDGTVVPEVLYVADKVGAAKVVLAGGAQAIAALAYGTESIPKVDKICGPGNQYVTAAKMLTQYDSSAMVSIDMPAGPSELLVIADETCNPVYVASDLLSQAEHGTDSQVVLIAVSLTSEHLVAIEREVHEQASRLPRVNIVRESIPKSFILQVATMQEAMQFSNDYAPEHLILHLRDAEKWVEKVENAGSVFVGSYSPESCGDYASGTNHTLPTYGYARMYSGVSTLTFLKHITAQQLTRDGLNGLADTVMRLAEIEGLEAHRNAVAVRVKDIRG